MPGFRVIILGAGPVGLFTAHALAAAGIDFIVLEKQPEIVRHRGTLIVLWPPYLRLIDQLGLSKAVMKYSTPFSTKTNFTHSGEPLCGGHIFDGIEKCLGYPTIGLSRGNLISVLYENLHGHETRVRANANAVNIEMKEDGVRVHLADGSVVDGSVVIAADGVHSPARDLIQRLEHGSSASGHLKPTSPMITTFLSLFGHTRCDREDIAFADFAESHGPGVASQSTRLRDGIYFTLLKRLEAPTSDRKRYTSQEMDKMVQELSDVNIFPHVKLKEIWPLRDQGNVLLLHQEEGLAEKWYHGRVVLVGDAAHKMTSVNGQGALTGVLSATALVNILRAALHRNPTPSTSALEAAFAKYEGARKHVSGQVVDLGKMVTRFITWTGDESESMDRELSQKTNMPEEAKARFVPLFVTSPILDFVPFKGKHGTVPWAMNVDPLIRAQL